MRVEDVDITASQGWQSFGARAKLVADQPRNFRMTASSPLLSGTAVDLGSNDQEFWFYVMKNNPPYPTQQWFGLATTDLGQTRYSPSGRRGLLATRDSSTRPTRNTFAMRRSDGIWHCCSSVARDNGSSADADIGAR